MDRKQPLRIASPRDSAAERPASRRAGTGRATAARAGISAVLAVVALTVVLAGCGSSSKPAYCKQVSELQAAVSALPNAATSVSSLTAAAQKVQTTALAAASAVKSEFGPQAQAVKSSAEVLGTSVKQLSSASTRASAAARIPTEATALESATTELVDATKQKCK